MGNQRIYGYTRVSTDQQRLERGIYDVERFCKERNYTLHEMITDKITGKSFERTGYERLRNDLLRSGDILIIPEVSRLGRTSALIKQELEYFKSNNIRIMILEIPTTTMDTDSLGLPHMAKMFVELITNMLIEFYSLTAETELIQKEKRQREGMQQKAIRAHLGIEEWNSGRPLKADEERFKEAYIKYNPRDKRKTRREQAEAKRKIQEELQISRTTYNRYEKKLKTGEPFRDINYEKWLPDKFKDDLTDNESENIESD